MDAELVERVQGPEFDSSSVTWNSLGVVGQEVEGEEAFQVPILPLNVIENVKVCQLRQ